MQQPQSDLVKRLHMRAMGVTNPELAKVLLEAQCHIEALEAEKIVMSNEKQRLSTRLEETEHSLKLAREVGRDRTAAAAQPEREAALVKAAREVLSEQGMDNVCIVADCGICGPWLPLHTALAAYTPATPDAGRKTVEEQYDELRHTKVPDETLTTTLATATPDPLRQSDSAASAGRKQEAT